MHPEAVSWIAAHATDQPVSVLDIGGRDVGGPWGGSLRPLFPNAVVFHVLDVEPGDDVDIVADAATWEPNGRRYDYVTVSEVFEHTNSWPAICQTIHDTLGSGGRAILTMAGPGRPPHGALGAPDLAPGEHYANIRPDRLRAVLERVGFTDVVIDQQSNPADVRAVATKLEVL